MHAARPLMADIDPGALAELGGERGPFLGREPGPALIVRRAETFRLHPNEAEIAARGAESDVTLVDQRRFQPRARQTIGDGRADQPAADDDRVKTLHGAIIEIGSRDQKPRGLRFLPQGHSAC